MPDARAGGGRRERLSRCVALLAYSGVASVALRALTVRTLSRKVHLERTPVLVSAREFQPSVVSHSGE